MTDGHPKYSLRDSARRSMPEIMLSLFTQAKFTLQADWHLLESNSKSVFRYFWYFYNTIAPSSKHTREKPDLFKDKLKLHYKQVCLIEALPTRGLHYMKSVKKSYWSQLQEGGRGLWLMNYPIWCGAFKPVGIVAACPGTLAVFTLVACCCWQYPRPNPLPSLLSQCCCTQGWLSSLLLLARTGFPGQDTAGTSGLAQTPHCTARASPASVPL